MPTIGKSPAVTSIDRTTLEHQNYLQLVFDRDKILNGYMEYYFRSSLGRMVLEDCYTGATISKITKKSLSESLDIYVPGLKQQALIAKTFHTLFEVTALMDDTAVQFSDAPNSAEQLLEKLIQTKDVFNKLSTEDQVLRLIRSGDCLLYTSPSPRDRTRSRMPSSA